MDNYFPMFRLSFGRVEGGYYPALLSVKSGRATFTAPSFRCS